MRVIEQKMIAVIRAGGNVDKTLGNTRVAAIIGGYEVQLHGNTIAHVYPDRVRFTLAGWPTPTTRSRVNALLREFVHANAGVSQVAEVQKYRSPANWDGATISSSEWVDA